MNLDAEFAEFKHDKEIDIHENAVSTFKGFVVWLIYTRKSINIEDIRNWAKGNGFLKK